MKKFTKSCVLAFFILGGFLITSPLNAQDSVTLQNGLRVIIKEDHKSPIVVFSAFIDVGSAQEDEYLGSGMCHLIEHMLFKGTDKYPKGRIEDILHMYGGNIDGFTSYDYTGYRITILKEHANVALDILKEMLSAPTFDPKELKKEMQVIEREIDLSRDDPGKRLSRLTFSRAYLKHPYRVPIIGYKENPPKRTIPTKEFIENKGLGFAVKDKNEMIEKINLLLSNKKLIEQIKQKSSVEIKNYETKKICDNFLLEIRRLIKK